MNILQLIQKIRRDQLILPILSRSLGATVKIGNMIQEGNKKRVQVYQGTLIAKHSAHRNSTITVRRFFQGIGVERVFFVASPTIQYIKILSYAKVRRAKLYYLRNVSGKSMRLRERIVNRYNNLRTDNFD
jgi:large subunit ribosomal protein L19